MDNKIVKKAIWGITASMLFVFLGCSGESPLQPENSKDAVTFSGMAKTQEDTSYPQTGSYTYAYWDAKDAYRGGTLICPNGTLLILTNCSLTPSPEILWGQDVTITATIDKDEVKDELIFDFGPEGCQFSPSAQVFLDYEDLGTGVPTLFYIDENGNYIEQEPDDIDLTNKHIILYIDHFSRYAVAFVN